MDKQYYLSVSQSINVGDNLSRHPLGVCVSVAESPTNDGHNQSQRRGIHVVDEPGVDNGFQGFRRLGHGIQQSAYQMGYNGHDFGILDNLGYFLQSLNTGLNIE